MNALAVSKIAIIVFSTVRCQNLCTKWKQQCFQKPLDCPNLRGLGFCSDVAQVEVGMERPARILNGITAPY